MFFGPKVRSITADKIADEMRMSGAVLIDVREPYEFAAGHVPDAQNLPLGSIPGSANSIAKDAHLLVICQSGNRSVAASKRLMKAGFSDVINIAGGTSAYRGKLKR